MQIIPAIDIIEGKCVRLTEGDYAQKKIYNEDPLEVAKQFEGVGLMRLHLVDLDGAKAGAVVNWKVLEKIANKTSLEIDFGGGIKTEATLKTVLDTGATYATIGSLAVKERATFEQWIERFGANIFMLGADVHAEKIANKTSLVIDFGGGIKTEATLKTVLDTGATYATIGSLAVKERVTFEEWIERFGANIFMLGADVHSEKIAVGGWLEKTEIDVYDFIGSYMQKGVIQIFCTDIQKDGKLEGPSIELYQKILELYPTLKLIASGGVSQLKDLEELRTIGCSAAIVGKAIYENKISLSELSTF